MKLPAILLAIAGSGLALLSWSQTWFEVLLVDGAGSGAVIAVGGDVASPALAALALAGLALAGALAIAGPGIRIVLGILAVLLGGCLVLAASLSLGSPLESVGPAVTDATGVTGDDPVAALVASAAATGWGAVAIAGGVLVVAAGVLVLATGHRWPSSSRRYRATRFDDGASGAPASTQGEGGTPARGTALTDTGDRARDRAIDEWDDLSRGEDPTD
ncbi:Trp biosynthesis-associated membrane protein [Agromyces sp. MMS24-K17]|uniref:Trp biosynthesis-associated membrane protein n=1 Tax=Agromyces sp. MMS24-K17 TaxID=3372850 RepID=UPI003754EE81